MLHRHPILRRLPQPRRRHHRALFCSIANRKSQVANAGSAFTLIEVLVAIGILALGCTAVLFLFTMGARSHRRAVDRTRAALLANALFDQIRADLATTLPERYTEDAGTKKISPIVDATHADFPEFTYNVSFTPLYEGTFYTVVVEVRWGDKGLPPDQRNSESYQSILRRKNS